MPVCSKIRKKKRQPCIGDMRDRITLEDRDLTAPLSGVDATELFTNPRIVFALIETVRGVEIFDASNVAQDITHKIWIRFDSTVTKETWIRLASNKRLRVVDVENLDERNEYLLLRCTERGSVDKQVADG